MAGSGLMTCPHLSIQPRSLLLAGETLRRSSLTQMD